MSELNVTSKPQGKGLAVTGFILSLVGLVFSAIVFGIVTAGIAFGGGLGLAYFWLVLCLASVVMSAMGMAKLGKTGGKKGLGIAGLVIGIVALIWSIVLFMGVWAIKAGAGDLNLSDKQQIEEMMNNLGEH